MSEQPESPEKYDRLIIVLTVLFVLGLGLGVWAFVTRLWRPS